MPHSLMKVRCQDRIYCRTKTVVIIFFLSFMVECIYFKLLGMKASAN